LRLEFKQSEKIKSILKISNQSELCFDRSNLISISISGVIRALRYTDYQC